MSENNEIMTGEEEVSSSELHKRKSFSNYFYIPHISLFTEGNTYTGSENTFNYRIEPTESTLKLTVWYGMKCYELSEHAAEYEDEKNEKGLSEIAAHIDSEYEGYMEKVRSGETEGRRTYKITDR